MTDDATPAKVRLTDGLGQLPARACSTTLLDLLRKVPNDARQVYEHSPTEHQNIPFGRLAQEAVDEIERLQAELAAAVTALPQAIRNERERCASIVEREVLKACPHLRESEFAALIRIGDA